MSQDKCAGSQDFPGFHHRRRIFEQVACQVRFVAHLVHFVLFRIVKNDTECVALAGTEPAHAMPHIDAICSSCPLHRAVMNGERYGVSLTERHDLNPGLHSRSLLGEHEFSTTKIFSRL